MIFKGVCTALVTPFNKNKSIDYVALKKLIIHQQNCGVGAILILGTTGESSTITYEEREKLIKFAKQNIVGCKLIVGTGTNNLQTTIKYTQQAKRLGADAVLIVTPYYNKCTQNGLVEYYKQIELEAKMPYIVYNVPSRTGFNINPNTYKKLAKLPKMSGIKEANGNIDHILEVFSVVGSVPIYCGNDSLNNIFMQLGAKGTISVTTNIFPAQVKTSLLKTQKGRQMSNKLYSLNKALFYEPNPIPVKYALFKLGITKHYVRSPLTIPQSKTKTILQKQLNIIMEGKW